MKTWLHDGSSYDEVLASLHPYRLDHGMAFRVGKRLRPQPVKDAIKPTFRRLGVLETIEDRFGANR